MNVVNLMGRLTRDPEIRTNGEMKIAGYTLAVDRGGKREDGKQSADFINCKAFYKQAEFAERFLKKGVMIAVTGRIQTGSYTNRDGNKVYTTDVVVNSHYFCGSKKESSNDEKPQNAPVSVPDGGFMDIPDNVGEELPFV